MSEADERPRRRQARGERRVTQLLQAAANVFCALGYTASSTNAIAREAGVSPGTLYQFFPNKEAIAVELGGKLIKEMESAHGQVFTPENARLPLDELIDAVAGPFIEFNCANPAFLALIKGPDAPGKVAEEHDTLHTTMLDGVTWMLAFRAPGLSTMEVDLVAQMSFAMFKAALDLVVQSEGEQRAAYAQEMKDMLYRYLAPYVGTGPVTTDGTAGGTAGGATGGEASGETDAEGARGAAEGGGEAAKRADFRGAAGATTSSALPTSR